MGSVLHFEDYRSDGKPAGFVLKRTDEDSFYPQDFRGIGLYYTRIGNGYLEYDFGIGLTLIEYAQVFPTRRMAEKAVAEFQELMKHRWIADINNDKHYDDQPHLKQAVLQTPPTRAWSVFEILNAGQEREVEVDRRKKSPNWKNFAPIGE